jgi:Uma2 family endonuclease
MQTGELITVREYLSTSYRPDCDYVDGVVLERNSGERDHAELQGAVFAYFYNRRKEWGIHVFPEQRVQVTPTRFRVPDVCVIAGDEPDEQIFTSPPFICIEVLSPEDRLSAMQKRVGDFRAMGVPYVWILDPRTRHGWRVMDEGLLAVAELRTSNPEIVVPLAALFE